MKLRERLFGSDYEDDSLVKHKSTYNVRADNSELTRMVNVIENMGPMKDETVSDNLTVNERRALDEIGVMCDTDLVIKIADKGNTLVLMDKSFYRDKMVMNDHLLTKTYCTANKKSDEKVMSEIKLLMIRHRSCLTEKEYKYICDFDWKSSNFYIMPKIHKSAEII